MEYSNNNRAEVYTARIRAGKRTYFFDVKATKSQDYYITITESKKRFNGEGYDKHKIFLYKEDFNKFLGSLSQTIDYVKTELMPDYDYNEFDRDKVDVTIDGKSMNPRPPYNPGNETPAADVSVAAEPKVTAEPEAKEETVAEVAEAATPVSDPKDDHATTWE